MDVTIIGAGISGLCAGVYLQKSGFNVTIYEQHTIPGGLSTSWKRRGFLFEGGMHWLQGSSSKIPLNRIWKDIGALDETNPIYNKDPVYTVFGGNKKLHFWRDTKKLKQHLIKECPQDKKIIKQIISDINAFRTVHLPIMDSIKLKTSKRYIPSLLELIKMATAAFKFKRLKDTSFIEYSNRIKDPDLHHLIRSLVGLQFNALSFAYTGGGFASGDYGYPKGGSLKMATNIAKKFQSLGGKICYKSKVQQIIIENNQIKGIQIDSKEIPCTKLICSTDFLNNSQIFPQNYREPFTQKILQKTKENQSMFFCAGIKMNLSNLPFSMVIPLKETITLADVQFDELRISNYAAFNGYAPENCTAITCILCGSSYNYWKKAKEEGTYLQKKEECSQKILAILDEKIPGIKNAVEVTDFATPLTYQRYTSTFNGSWMSIWEKKKSSIKIPAKSPTTLGLYYAGMRCQTPGGLPVAVYSGYKAAQQICIDTKTKMIK